MAEVIGAAILSAVGASAVAGTTVLGVSVATIVGTTALVGGSLAVQALTATDDRQKVAGQQYAKKQSLPARQRSWGRVKLAGPFVAHDSAGGSFFIAIYHGEGPYDAVEQIWLDDVLSAFPSGALLGIAGVAPWSNAVTLEARLGAASQAASALLLGLPYWSADHRLDGCVYTVLRAAAPEEDKFKRVYPSGTWPTARTILRAAKVRNPAIPAQTENPATWAWTDLCAPCIRDLVTDPQWGFQVPPALIDDSSFAAEATVDAQLVTNRAGLSTPRYRLSGTLDLTDEPADTLQGMLDACDRKLFLTPEGKVGLTGGRYIPPDVTIGQDAVLALGNIEFGSGRRAAFNRLITSFVSPLHNYEIVEGAVYERVADQVAAGQTLEKPFSRAWVNDHNQLQRLAKIHYAKSNPAWRITGLVTNRKGLPGLFEDTIQLDLPRYGISGPATVERAVAASDGATCIFDLVALDPDAYTFVAATEEGEPPAVTSGAATGTPPDPPAGLVTTLERRAVYGSTVAVFLHLSATPPTRIDLSLIGRYRKVGDTSWLDMVKEDETRGKVVSSVVADGSSYELQGAVAGYGRAVQSAWFPPTPLVLAAVADPTAPGKPVYVSASREGNQSTVNHVVDMPRSANARSLALYRTNGYAKTISDIGTNPVDTQVGAPSQRLSLSDQVDLGLYRYYPYALNGSGVASPVADASPKEIVRALQPGNLLSAPNNFTNSVWTKLNLTAELTGGNDADGGATTQLLETAVTGQHYAEQTVTGLSAGSKLRAAILVKGVSRNRGAIYLGTTSAMSNRAQVTFNTTTNAAAVGSAGSGVTGLSASMIRLSVDEYLVLLTATVAGTSIITRFYDYNDAGTASYAGETTKGYVLSAASLAVVP